MKKIAILVTSKSKPGGVERRFLNLFNYISKEKDFVVRFMAFDTFLKEFELPSELSISLEKQSLFRLSYQIIKKLRDNNISHLHIAANPSLLSMILHPLCMVYGISSSISVVTSRYTKRSDFNFYEKIYYQISYLFVKRIDFLSQEIFNVSKKVFFLNEKKSNVSPCSFISPKVKEIINNDRQYDICFVSRLIPLKGFEFFLETLSDIEDNLKIKICGDGELINYYKKLKTRLAHHTIEIGYCEKTDEIYANSKIFVSLQKYNNYPSQSLLEAIFQGCAIIATDVGETRKILNDGNSVLIKDKKEFIKAIKIMVNDDKQRGLLASKVNQEVFKTHNIENFTKYFLEKVVNL